MQQLTREEWREVAERLGDSATGLEEVAEKYGAHVMDSSWQQLVDDLRLAVAAVLWVSEHAADEIRFDVVDARAGGDACEEGSDDQEHGQAAGDPGDA